MIQSKQTNLTVLSLFVSFLLPIILAIYYREWVTLIGLLSVDGFIILLVAGYNELSNKINSKVDHNTAYGSLYDSVDLITDINQVKFEESEISFQQEYIYKLIKTKQVESVADLYSLYIAFLTCRSIDKNIQFRNLPQNIIDFLVDKAYNTAKRHNSIFENENNIFDEIT